MGNDLAKADAVNTALANQRGCAAHDAVTGVLLLGVSTRPRDLLPGVHAESVFEGDDDRHRGLLSSAGLPMTVVIASFDLIDSARG